MARITEKVKIHLYQDADTSACAQAQENPTNERTASKVRARAQTKTQRLDYRSVAGTIQAGTSKGESVMSKLMKYKGYEGSAEVSFEDKVLYGKILHIRDLIMYEGDSVEAIKEAFEAAVDDYLADCLELAHSYEGLAAANRERAAQEIGK